MTETEPGRGTSGEARNYSPWAYWRLRLEEVEPEDPFPDGRAEDYDAWRARVADRLAGMLAPWPEPVPTRLEVLGEERRDGLVVQDVVFDAERYMSVPARLLLPPGADRAPRPAVLAIHGHGLDKDRLCGIDGGDAEARAAIDDNNGDYARQLARRGFVVLAPDLRTFGARADRMLPAPPPDDLAADIVHHHFVCDYQLVCGVMAGVLPITQNLWDLRVSLGVLAKHPAVDAGQLGVAGWSYGGTLALILAAIDERVRAAVVSCFFSSWRSAHAMPWNMCGNQVLWGMLGRLEHLDLGALVAPRPLCVESAAADELFPAPEAVAQLARLRLVYEHGGAPPDALVHDVFPGDHGWHGTESIRFLQHHLGLRT